MYLRINIHSTVIIVSKRTKKTSCEGATFIVITYVWISVSQTGITNNLLVIVIRICAYF